MQKLLKQMEIKTSPVEAKLTQDDQPQNIKKACESSTRRSQRQLQPLPHLMSLNDGIFNRAEPLGLFRQPFPISSLTSSRG